MCSTISTIHVVYVYEPITSMDYLYEYDRLAVLQRANWMASDTISDNSDTPQLARLSRERRFLRESIARVGLLY